MTQRVWKIARPVVAAGLVVAAVAGATVAGLAQSGPPAASDPSLTGATHTDDLVLARQLLMQSNETAMMPIDSLLGGADVDLRVLKARAYDISSNLLIAPHLFPSSTKPVYDKDGSPTPSTAASPKIWDDFEAFYTAMTDAANLAYDASQAADLDRFQAVAKQLRESCDSCHATHMNVQGPSP